MDVSGTQGSKEDLLFLKKKKQKDFWLLFFQKK